MYAVKPSSERALLWEWIHVHTGQKLGKLFIVKPNNLNPGTNQERECWQFSVTNVIKPNYLNPGTDQKRECWHLCDHVKPNDLNPDICPERESWQLKLCDHIKPNN